MKKYVTIFLAVLFFGQTEAVAQITYSEHIAPIIYDNCTVCHRQGEIGRMALTNYIVQGLLIHLILSGIGLGLDLGGEIGTRDLLLLSLAIFFAQTVLSHVWLKTFNYGPLEWLWRSLTYGQISRFRTT